MTKVGRYQIIEVGFDKWRWFSYETTIHNHRNWIGIWFVFRCTFLRIEGWEDDG